ncbi:Cytochrome-P450 [Teratosphaeria destructans]|uniref:Cytochrome-P450 n=1 Tax=Teratosphaeria destructans TaxID=418781 RepID=A0A9W7SQP5_9PEZI|nr:Cytochrome-P450 [Teratosphaeria destructans]
MSIWDKLERYSIFSTKWKLTTHIIQLVLVVIACGLTAPRLFIKTPGPRTRTNTIALSMGAKSIVILAYVILTDHVERLAKWRSLKAQLEIYSFVVAYLEWRAWKRARNMLPTSNNRANTNTAYDPVHANAPGNQDLPPHGTRYEMTETRHYGRNSDGSDASDVALKTGVVKTGGPWDQAHVRDDSRGPRHHHHHGREGSRTRRHSHSRRY